MGAGDADDFAPVGGGDFQLPFADNRLFILADLIALRQVGVEVVLAREHRALVNLRADREPKLDRQPRRFEIHHRQCAGQRDAEGAGLGVGVGAVVGRRGGEDFAARFQLHMHLQTDDRLPPRGFSFHHAYPGGVCRCQSVSSW